MHPKRFWSDMTTKDIKDTQNWITVLPICAIEQHGNHLPLSTDWDIGKGNVHAVVDKIPPHLPVTFLPAIPYGKSDEHVNFNGTLSLSYKTLIAIIEDIGEGLAKAGVKKLILANSHGGNVSVMDIAARELRIKHKMLVVQLSWHRLGYPTGMFSEREQKFGIHGGQIETAQMLHLRPDLVNMEKAENYISANEQMSQKYNHLRATSPIPFAWMSEDLNVSGALGNATIATAKQGKALEELMAKNFIELCEDVNNFAIRPHSLITRI